MRSDEVVQVYASVPNSTVPAPRTRLVAFERVRDIAPGASVHLKLIVQPDAHAVVYPSSSVYEPQLAVERGPLVWSVGGSQDSALRAIVQVPSTTMLLNHRCEA